MPHTVVSHPLAAVQLTRLRDHDLRPGDFRRALHELSRILVYEATREVQTRPIEVVGPLEVATGVAIALPPIIVPVLRAGLGMLDAALELFPDAPVGFVGLKRDEQTLLPSAYVASVPANLDGRPALVLDPMLATGGSLIRTCGILTENRVGPITIACVCAAPEGVAALEAAAFDAELYVATIDDRLDEDGFIRPGLGDAGDRTWGVEL